MTITHMKREIAEIPEATARLLSQASAAVLQALRLELLVEQPGRLTV